MNVLLVFLLAASLLLAGWMPSPASAAKKFGGSKNTAPVAKAKSSSSSRVPSTVRYRPDKNGVFLSFSNFSGIESVAYSFTYTGNGLPQGIGGTIAAGSNPTASRELLFGTCSSGACTYHRNLKDAKLTLTAKFANGKIATKIYRIKTYH